MLSFRLQKQKSKNVADTTFKEFTGTAILTSFVLPGAGFFDLHLVFE